MLPEKTSFTLLLLAAPEIFSLTFSPRTLEQISFSERGEYLTWKNKFMTWK